MPYHDDVTRAITKKFIAQKTNTGEEVLRERNNLNEKMMNYSGA